MISFNDLQVVIDREFYEWLKELSHEEILSDYPLLSKILSKEYRAALSVLRLHDKKYQTEVLEALIEQKFFKKIYPSQKIVTDKSQTLLENFRKKYKCALEKIDAPQIKSPVDWLLLGDCIKHQILQKLEVKEVTQNGFFSWKAELSINDSWKIEILIILGGRSKIQYIHRLFHVKNRDLASISIISIDRAFGIGSGAWNDCEFCNPATTAANLIEVIYRSVSKIKSFFVKKLKDSDINISLLPNKNTGGESFKEARNEFGRRIVKKLKAIARSEQANKFDTLLEIKSTTSFQLYDTLATMTKPESLKLLDTLIEYNSGYEVFKLLDKGWNNQDQQRVDSFVQKLNSSNISASLQLHFNLKKTEIDKKRLKKLLKSDLESILGKVYNSRGPELIFRKTINKWIVYTEIDTGGLFQIRYFHWVALAENPDLRFGPSVSFFNCMGLNGDTNWNLLCEKDIPDAIFLLKRFCFDFINDLPDLLEGL